MDPLKWLSAREGDFSSLTVDEIKAINDFFLVWSYFEEQKLDCTAGRVKFLELAVLLANQNKLGQNFLGEMVTYFRERYVSDNSLNYRVEYLHLEQSRNPQEVTDMLLKIDCDETTQFIGCLFIVYRYRNNLFHGPKWRSFLKEQKCNMEMSSKFLISIMDLT
ncbi:hypothetical protein [Vibrio splendidus]|uniref:hypothetical protein n=1 Tax=Vibrio splendidus TaxID=29497 RepID=UPI000D39882A|nr:hypothetical protein [Vibrio splendidus]PTP92517.1 hypothetical protein CWO03_02530 [Vibrio splendidus]